VRRFILVYAAAAFGLAPAASAQSTPAAPKSVTRAEFVGRIDTNFNVLDTNHDGFLSPTEVTAGQARQLQQVMAARQARFQAEFKQLDTNRDGQLSFPEFLAAAPTVKANETPAQILQKLDTNKDGKVSAAEFRAPQLAIFVKLDANHDGVVAPAELQAYAKEHPTAVSLIR